MTYGPATSDKKQDSGIPGHVTWHDKHPDTWFAVAQLVLVCREDRSHTLGALLRVDSAAASDWPLGVDESTKWWSDGAGNLLMQQWGRHGALALECDDDSTPRKIIGVCRTCNRRALSRSRPELSWKRVPWLLDRLARSDTPRVELSIQDVDGQRW